MAVTCEWSKEHGGAERGEELYQHLPNYQCLKQDSVTSSLLIVWLVVDYWKYLRLEERFESIFFLIRNVSRARLPEGQIIPYHNLLLCWRDKFSAKQTGTLNVSYPYQELVQSWWRNVVLKFYKLLSDLIYSSFYKWLIFLKITSILQPCAKYEVVSLIFLLEYTSLCLRFSTQNQVSHCYDRVLATMDILQKYLHRNHLNLVQNVNKLREAMKFLWWCRAFDRMNSLITFLRARFFLSLSVPPPSRYTSGASWLHWKGAFPWDRLGSCDEVTQKTKGET